MEVIINFDYIVNSLNLFMMIEHYFPSIISNKIYWYLWRFNQTNLCIEYNQRIEYDENGDIWFYTHNESERFPHLVNWRNLNFAQIKAPIYSITDNPSPPIGKLPKNYYSCKI